MQGRAGHEACLHDGLGDGVLEAELLDGVHKALVQLGRPHQPRPLQRPGLVVIHIICAAKQPFLCREVPRQKDHDICSAGTVVGTFQRPKAVTKLHPAFPFSVGRIREMTLLPFFSQSCTAETKWKPRERNGCECQMYAGISR